MTSANEKIAKLIFDEETKYFNKRCEKSGYVLRELIDYKHDNKVTYKYFDESSRQDKIEKLIKLIINPWQDLSRWQGEASRAICELNYNNVSIKFRSTNYSGDSPLHIAVKNGCQLVVNTIVNEYKSNIHDIINFKNNFGETPLHFALIGNYNTKILFDLISNGADFKSTDNKGQTPLVMVLLFWKRDYLANAVLDLITDYDIHKTDKKGQNLVYLAAEYRQNDIYHKLIKMGANPHVKANNNQCAEERYEFNEKYYQT